MIAIVPLHAGISGAFYALAAEYLPGSDPARMHRLSAEYPDAFLALTLDQAVIGVAFGWPRALFAPEDPSFVLDGIVIRQEYQHNGYGRLLLAAFEQAALRYGAKVVSVGAAPDAVPFYARCGYAAKCWKRWENGQAVVAAVFAPGDDPRASLSCCLGGFVVMEKTLPEQTN